MANGTTLRHRLRHDSRAIHDQLDHMVSRFDLTDPRGLSAFLGMTVRAMRQIARDDLPATLSEAMGNLQSAAERDLTALGASVDHKDTQRQSFDPLAVGYVIAGSRFGGAVLRKRWAAAADPAVRRANAYFGAPSYSELWAEFCQTATALPAEGAAADKVLRDTKAIFGLYQAAAQEGEDRHALARV